MRRLRTAYPLGFCRIDAQGSLFEASLQGRSGFILLQLIQAVPNFAVKSGSKISLRLRNFALEVAVVDLLDHAAESYRDVLSFRFGPIAVIGLFTLCDWP
jgi:hypothetical protein